MNRRNPMVLAFECILAGVIIFVMMYFCRKVSFTSALLESLLVTAVAGVGSYFYLKRTANK